MKNIILGISTSLLILFTSAWAPAFFFKVGAADAVKDTLIKGQEQKKIPSVLAPGDLRAVATSTTQISLLWTDISNNEDGFKIERKSIGGFFMPIAVLESGRTTFTDSNLNPNQMYTYRVYAFNSQGISVYSPEATALTWTYTPTASPVIPIASRTQTPLPTAIRTNTPTPVSKSAAVFFSSTPVFSSTPTQTKTPIAIPTATASPSVVTPSATVTPVI